MPIIALLFFKKYTMRKFFNWCELNSRIIVAFATVVEVMVGATAAGFIIYQFQQSNKLKQFDNYNYFNKVYSDWYDEISDDIKKNTSWEKLNNKDQAWVRRYFDLYSQEYYFYRNKMIPPAMWEELIHGKNDCNGAAIVNFRRFPILVTGYIEWKKMGAFKYPTDFINVLDKKLTECDLLPK
jgi:hypothetical protein